jgi:hypothetical protein
MKRQKGHDYSELLIWAAAIVTVVRYAAAFIASDMGEITGVISSVITVLMGLSGLGMGILDVVGGTYLFDGWRRSMPATGKAWTPRFKVLTAFVFSLMLTGVMILVPFTMSRVTHKSMGDILNTEGRLTWWALLVNLAPYLLIGGVAVGNQVVSVSSGNFPETFQKVSDDDGKLSSNFPNDWRKVRKMLSAEQLREMSTMGSGDIAYKYGVSERTASNWRKNAKAEVSVEVTQ